MPVDTHGVFCYLELFNYPREREIKMTREKAKQILESGKLYQTIKNDPEDEREIYRCSDGIHCNSWNKFDHEFVTNEIETALDYIYPN